MERFTSPDHMQRAAWDLMYRAAVNRNDVMRTPAMATFDGAKVHQRTIVLRKVDKAAQELFFFTDRRSPKVAHLEQDQQLNVLFWHPRKKVQIEAIGKSVLHYQDDLCRSFWEQLNIGGRSSYATLLAPGTPQLADSTNLPQHWSKEMILSLTESNFQHFVVIQMQVTEMDILHLHSDGHQRAFIAEKEKTWLVP